jgi:hypothetical protein
MSVMVGFRDMNALRGGRSGVRDAIFSAAGFNHGSQHVSLEKQMAEQSWERQTFERSTARLKDEPEGNVEICICLGIPIG